MPLPDDALEQLRKFRASSVGGDENVDVGEIWEVPSHLVWFVVEAKSRPHLVAATLGSSGRPTRAYAIEGTSRPQAHNAPLCLTLMPGEGGVVTQTHFVFVAFRLRPFDVAIVLSECSYWGTIAPDRLVDIEAAIAASRIVVLRRSRGLSVS